MLHERYIFEGKVRGNNKEICEAQFFVQGHEDHKDYMARALVHNTSVAKQLIRKHFAGIAANLVFFFSVLTKSKRTYCS